MMDKPSKSIVFVALGASNSILSLRVRSLAEELEGFGWKVIVVFCNSDDPKMLRRDYYRYSTLKLSGFFSTLRTLYLANKDAFFHFLNPEIRASLVGVCFPGMKIVGDWEDVHGFERDRGIRRLVVRASDRFMRWRSNRLIAASLWLKNDLSAFTGNEVLYLPYAILPREFPVAPNPFVEPTAVFMGAFHRQWDHSVLFEALRILHKRGNSPKVQFIGDGEDWNHWREFLKREQMDNVEMTGYLDWDQMLNNLQWAHVLLFPIRDKLQNKARCPFKIFQYAQARRPIITSDVGDVKEFLGDRAVYIPADVDLWADAIERIMQQPRLGPVDYKIESQTWKNRAAKLNEYLSCSISRRGNAS